MALQRYTVTLRGRVNGNMTIDPITSVDRVAQGLVRQRLAHIDQAMEGEPPPPPPPDPEITTRRAADWPFTGPFVVPLSTSATYEANNAGTKTRRFITNAANATINWKAFSIGLDEAVASDPDVTITNTSNNSTHTGQKIPADYVPPAGGGGFEPDGATNIAQIPTQIGNVTGVEMYRPKKVTNTSWTCLYNPLYIDLKGTGINAGRRAGGMSYANGVIRDWVIAAILAGTMTEIPWQLAFSLPKESLKKTPTSADGEVMFSGGLAVAVWPARLQDNQANIPYSTAADAIPMGSTFAVRPDFNLDTWLISGVAPTPFQKALGRTLQNRGAVATDQSTTWAFYGEPKSEKTPAHSAALTSGITAIRSLIPEFRRVTNIRSDNVGGGPAPRRAPDAPPFA